MNGGRRAFARLSVGRGDESVLVYLSPPVRPDWIGLRDILSADGPICNSFTVRCTHGRPATIGGMDHW